MRIKYRVLLLLVLLLASALSAVRAQDEMPMAEFVNDEGGVLQVAGTMPVNNPNLRTFTALPLILLEDQGGMVQRDRLFVPSAESQVLGQFIDNFYDESDNSIDFRLSLPAKPQGASTDVDNDGEEDAGVQVYQVAFWVSRYNDTFIDRYDFGGYGGWSTSDSSARFSTNPETLYEVTGGRLLVYAPDDQQGFPAGFGDDGLLFTEDDPVVGLPAGFTMVDLDSDPFTFDRSSTVTMNTYEAEEVVPDDFSDMTYTEAFAALLEIGRNEYAYNVDKNIDWDALEEEFMPRFEEAEANEDAEAYLFAMYDFALRIPDGHVSFFTNSSTVLEDAEQERIGGGLGIALRELTDGRLLVNFLLEDSPAAAAGIEYGAEITAIDGVPIDEAINAVQSVNAPYSLPSVERLDQIRFVVRFPVDIEVEVSFINPGGEEETVTMTTVPERASLGFSRQFVYGPRQTVPRGPIEYNFIATDAGFYGYVAVYDFFVNERVLIENWETFLRTANQFGAAGIIIDLRANSGGFGAFSNRMAPYLYEEEIQIGFDDAFNRDIGDFFYDDTAPELLLPPRDPSLIYTGPVAILVSPACASACEFFAYYMTREDRAAVVGQYGTNGIAGGRYFDIALPEDSFMSLPTIRSIDMDGNSIIESQGIQPTVLVPITEENMAVTAAEQDLVYDAAVAYLDDVNTPDITITDGGSIAVGDEVTGDIAVGERVQYVLEITEDVTVDITLGDESGQFDTYLRLYDTDGNLLAENDDAEPGRIFNSALLGLEIPAGFTLIIEVGTFDDAGEGTYNLAVTVSGG
ncbi:MAG: PDZ domain-containing protein [Chloroflexi bacterium]|nr:PDZ domain-containing protein [Chloroflexota bacterium]